MNKALKKSFLEAYEVTRSKLQWLKLYCNHLGQSNFHGKG